MGVPTRPGRAFVAAAWLSPSHAYRAHQSWDEISTLGDFEGRRRKPIANNLGAIKRALQAAGIEFTDGDVPGVRMRK